MTTRRQRTIELLPTGVPGLDTVLGGGLPEYSFNVIAGDAGSGKTTLAQQIAFSRAMVETPAIYFTVLGEPPLKMLRHMQQYTFFDPAKVGPALRFVNLSAEAMAHDLDSVLEHMLAEIEEFHPATVVVDSFRAVTPASRAERQLQAFVQKLALHLTGCQATTFLVGEYSAGEAHTNPLFTIADGVLWLTQNVERSSSVRRMQVTKMRGGATMPGLHTFVMSWDGICVLPRILPPAKRRPRGPVAPRASTGVDGLDAMMSGGIPAGASALFVGPSGVGKSTFARHFIAAGADAGEPGIIVVFEEESGEYVARASAFGPELASFIERGVIEVVSLRSFDLTVDEALATVRLAVERKNARRLVIDSLSEFELALTPSYREDFREALFRTIMALTGIGVTVLMTVDIVQSFTELGLSPHVTEFLTDVLVLSRYVELEGRLDKVLAVVKMRASRHDRTIRRYAIEPSGIVVGEPVHGHGGILTGVPLVHAEGAATQPGLTREENALLAQLRELGEADARALARRSALKGAALSAALDRLRQLNHLSARRKKGVTVYRARVTK